MGFFSELGKKTTETTGKIAKETKLKLKMNENKGKIKDIYEEIGKKVYEKHIREENIDIKNDLLEECSQIDSLSKEIEDARLEILKLNQKRLCTKCSAEIETEALFCPKCGEKQPLEQKEKTVKEEAIEKLEEGEVSPGKEKEAESVIKDLKEETKETDNNNNG